MIECAMPQDILKRKSKFIANFTVREVCCTAVSFTLGMISYFSWCKDIESYDLKILITMIVILPFLLIGFIKVYDQPFEKLAPNIIIENFIYPIKRKKETHFNEFEKYESTRYWLRKDKDINAEVESKRKKKKTTPQKIVIEKSQIYKGIK